MEILQLLNSSKDAICFTNIAAVLCTDRLRKTVSSEKLEVYKEEDFVMITDMIPDAIMEIRYCPTFNLVGERINAYEAPVAYLTKAAVYALKDVSVEQISQGYRIIIYDVYRPQTAVDHFKAWAEDLSPTEMKSYFYPEMDKNELFEKGYIAEKSGHSRSTVDIPEN